MFDLTTEQISDRLFEYSPLLEKDDIQFAAKVCCPVALATIPVQEQYERDFSMIDGMVLYMYSIGYRSSEMISKLTAIDKVIVEGSLNLLIRIEKLIDPVSGTLTPRGAEALKNFKDENTTHSVELDARRNIQIEAVTGSIFPSSLEADILEPIPSDELKLLPALNKMKIDEILYDEINKRLKEYIENDLIANGDSIIKVGEFTISKIMYRSCYLVKYKKMEFPLLVFESGGSDHKSAASRMRKNKERILSPVSFSDSETVALPNIIRRKSGFFQPLLESIYLI